MHKSIQLTTAIHLLVSSAITFFIFGNTTSCPLSFWNPAFLLHPDTLSKSLIYITIDKPPHYPGGNEAEYNFLDSLITYPRKAFDEGIQGKVLISFIVETDGSLTDIKVLRGIGGGCDEAAIQAVEAMPKWIPGKKDSIPVRVLFNLPVKFKMTESPFSEHAISAVPCPFKVDNEKLKIFLTRYKDEDAVMIYQIRVIYNSHALDFTSDVKVVDRYHYTSYRYYNQSGGYFGNSPVYGKMTGTFYNPIVRKYQPSDYISQYVCKYEMTEQKILILNERGAEKYASIPIPIKPGKWGINFSGTMLEINGNIVEIQRENLKANPLDGKIYLTLPPEKIKAGDTITLSYSGKRSVEENTYKEVFMSAEIPLFYSSARFYFDNSITWKLKYYNGLSNPAIAHGIGNYSLHFSLFEPGPMDPDNDSIVYKELPYVKYDIKELTRIEGTDTLIRSMSPKTWPELINNYLVRFSRENPSRKKCSYLGKFIENQRSYCKGCDPVMLFEKILTYITDSLKIEKNCADSKYTSGYFLYYHKIDPDNLVVLIKDLLDTLHINYYHCLAPGRSHGTLDTSFIAPCEFKYSFFAYEEKADSVNYIFPENIVNGESVWHIMPEIQGSDLLIIDGSRKGKYHFGKIKRSYGSIN
jgi:TonB family protein